MRPFITKYAFVAVSAALLGAGPCLAAEPNEVAHYKCAYAIQEETSAFVANDWPAVERIAARTYSACKSVSTPAEAADHLGSIAEARFRRGNFKGALAMAAECISLYYGDPGCHFVRARSFLALGRQGEASASLALTIKLAEHALYVARQDLERAKEPSQQAALNGLIAFRQAILDESHKLQAAETN